MTTVTPPEAAAPAYPTGLASTTASANLDASTHKSVVKVPFGGALAAASVLGSLLHATSVMRVWPDSFALTLREAEFHGQPGGVSKSTSTFQIDDLRPLLTGTSLITINYDNVLADPFRSTHTRMTELHSLAPDLSLRQWADLFGVSKQAIRNWVASEPTSRPELDAALRALRAATVRQPDLASWLQSPLPGSTRTPLQLAQGGRWRALSAASRMAAPVGLGTAPTQEMRERVRERRAVSKRLGGADAPPAADDED
jgi:hypothetical protein